MALNIQEGSDILVSLLNTAKALDVPFAQDFKFGLPQPSPEKVLEERVKVNDLNGSGPNNAELAKQLPQTFESLITGERAKPSTVVKQSAFGGDWIAWAALAAAIFGAFILPRYKS